MVTVIYDVNHNGGKNKHINERHEITTFQE